MELTKNNIIEYIENYEYTNNNHQDPIITFKTKHEVSMLKYKLYNNTLTILTVSEYIEDLQAIIDDLKAYNEDYEYLTEEIEFLQNSKYDLVFCYEGGETQYL